MGAQCRARAASLAAARSSEGLTRDRASPDGCAASPRCRLPLQLRQAFGGLPATWLHYGPIGAQTTPLHTHDGDDALDGDWTYDVLPTRAAHGNNVGASLDVFCLRDDPGHGVKLEVVTLGSRRVRLWRVYAAAWNEPNGPVASWVAPGCGAAREGYLHWFGDALPGLTSEAALWLLDELLIGRRRRGRPPRFVDQSWRPATERAMQRKREQPLLPMAEIAQIVGLSERALRNYMRMIEREQHQEELHLLGGGDS